MKTFSLRSIIFAHKYMYYFNNNLVVFMKFMVNIYEYGINSDFVFSQSHKAWKLSNFSNVFIIHGTCAVNYGLATILDKIYHYFNCDYIRTLIKKTFSFYKRESDDCLGWCDIVLYYKMYSLYNSNIHRIYQEFFGATSFHNKLLILLFKNKQVQMYIFNL